MYKVSIELAPCCLQEPTYALTGPSAEHAKSKTSDTILRRSSSADRDITRTGRCALTDDNPKGHNNPVREITTGIKFVLRRLGASPQRNLPSLWEVLSDCCNYGLSRDAGGSCGVEDSAAVFRY